MKKILSLLALLVISLVGGLSAMAQSGTVDDLVAITSDYTFIADNVTANGTTALTANTLYDEKRIFANTGNSVNASKGKSTIGGVEHLNCLRLKNIQDQLVFKVGGPCTVKFYTQSHASRGIQVGSSEGGTQFGVQPVSTTEWECTINKAGLVYLSSYSGDFFFAGFEVTPMPKTVTFVNDANWEKVYVWAWNQETQENFTGGKWPGQEMTEKDSEENYTWSTYGNPTHIIFSNGTTQTADLEFKDGGKYNSTGRIIDLNTYTATFTTDGMDEVWAYAWNGDDKPLGAWPGTKLEGTGGTFNVSIKAEEMPQFIIFHNNNGDQTPDLEFEDGKAYEYNLNTYTATFTTDAGWETVRAYAWTYNGDKVKEFLDVWPGTALTADEGVYSLSFKAFEPPVWIQFNDGTDNGKTPDLIFTDGRAYKWITTVTPLYALKASDEKIPAGTKESVKDESGEEVATITYGVPDGEPFAAPATYPHDEYAGFTAYTAGNGVNGDAEGGTIYTIVPKYNGSITVGVWLNAGKKLYIQEDGESLPGFNGMTIPYKANTAFTFDVKAGSSYKIYCAGSKLGLFGFDYQYENTTPITITSVDLMGSSNNWAEPIATFSAENPSTGYWTANDVKFAANDQFKIHVTLSNNTDKWLVPESNGNFLVNQDVLDKDLKLVEGGNNNMYVENAATLSFSLNPGFTLLTITGEITVPTINDELTYTLIGTTDTNYKDFTGIKDQSDAVYAGNSAGGNESIQLRSKNSTSGIVTTTSGGKVKSIKVEWNDATDGTRVLDVYGKNEAYTAASNLYSSATQGTKIASFTKSDGTKTIEIEGDYAYIGLRSNSGAMYIDKITIEWEAGSAPVILVAKPTFAPADGKAYAGAQEITMACETEGATIYYNINDDKDPTPNSLKYDAPFTIRETSTIKAIAVKDADESEVATATYTIVESIANVKEQPYTVAQALQLINNNDAATLAAEGNQVYVKGKVNSIEEISTQFGNATYNIIGEDGSELKIYHGYYLDNVKFTEENKGNLTEGKIVVVYGYLKDYVKTGETGETHTPEMDSYNYIVSIETPINSMAIVGELTGGWPTKDETTGEEDWTVAKPMIQSTENPAIWTLTVEGFEAEGKKYEYKAVANNNWNDYVLPAGDNANFIFGTDEYPAGKYNLTFTADTENHTVTVDAEPVLAPTGIIPDGTYYVMNANEGTLVNAAGALDAKGAPITFTFNAANNAYTIEGADFFSGKQWTVANAFEGMSGFYTISTTDGFLAANSSALEQIADGTADAAVWILLEKAYWEDIVNSTYTVAGTKDLTGTENDWDIDEANQMTLNDITGLYEKVFKNIAVNDESQPAFKVVQTNMEGVQTWYPEGGNSTNWVITPNVVGGEGLFDITITFDPSDSKEIKVSAVKIEPELALGDVNGDTEVTTTDAVMAVDFALGKSVPTTAQFNAANVVKAAAGEDEAITVADAIGIVNIAIGKSNDDPAAGARLFDEGNNFLTLNGKTLSLTNTTAFAGFQMDVTLAEGAQFNGAQLTERASNLKLVYNRIGENTWRIIALSLQGNTISGSNGALLTLDIMGNSTVSVSNIEFADAAANAYALGFGGATGINGVYGVSADSDIYNVNGVRTNTMHKGMNIIRNANGEVKKVFVK